MIPSAVNALCESLLQVAFYLATTDQPDAARTVKTAAKRLREMDGRLSVLVELLEERSADEAQERESYARSRITNHDGRDGTPKLRDANLDVEVRRFRRRTQSDRPRRPGSPF